MEAVASCCPLRCKLAGRLCGLSVWTGGGSGCPRPRGHPNDSLLANFRCCCYTGVVLLEHRLMPTAPSSWARPWHWEKIADKLVFQYGASQSSVLSLPPSHTGRRQTQGSGSVAAAGEIKKVCVVCRGCLALFNLVKVLCIHNTRLAVVLTIPFALHIY